MHRLYSTSRFIKYRLQNDLKYDSIYEPRHDKPNNVAVRQAKTQISPGIRPV